MVYNRDKNIQISKNFWSNEFACKDGSKEILINIEGVQELQRMRDWINAAYTDEYEIIITSAYRTPSYNKIVGGIEDSEHIHGKAWDIKVRNKRTGEIMTPEEVFYIAVHFNFSCIIIYDKFVHVDVGSYHGRLDKREVHRGRMLTLDVV